MSALLLLLLTPTPQSAPAPLPKAEEILAQYEAKLGDPAARAKIKNVVVRGKISGEMMPENAHFEQSYAAPDRAKWTFDCGDFGTMTQGMTTEYCWSADPRGVAIFEGEAQAPLRHSYGLARRAPWNAIYAKSELVRKTEVGGRPAYELRMIASQGKPDIWFIDAATSMLLRVDTRAPDPVQEMSLRYEPSDWRMVDGVLYPFASTMTIGEYAMISKVTAVEHPAEIEAARVAPAESVIAAWKDPKKRMKPAPEKGGEFTRVTLEPQPAATVRVKISEKEFSQVLASIFPEIMKHLTSTGADMASPPFTRIHERKDGMVDLEAGLAVKKPIRPNGRIKASELPGGEAAVTWHFGKYEDLPKSYALLESWMKSNALAPGGGGWEVYWTDPGLEPDSSKWKTQILIPIKPAK